VAVMTMLAPGTIAPDASVTEPEIVPVPAVCAVEGDAAKTAKIAVRTRASRRFRAKRRFITGLLKSKSDTDAKSTVFESDAFHS
jgi:hypothetical protein